MIKIEKDEDLLLKNRIVSINGNEVGIIYLKNNEWMFTPSIQNSFSKTYASMDHLLMIEITNEIATLNKRGLTNDNNKHSG